MPVVADRDPARAGRTDEEREWRLLCPECRGAAFVAEGYLYCPAEGRRARCRDGIYPLLSAAARRRLEPFLAAYRTVRAAEGWGGDAAYYRGLPFRDGSGRHRSIWTVRARSYRLLVRELARAFGPATGLRILELGAGNCWLAARLAALGHDVLATDVSADPVDGLGAYDRYGSERAGRVERALAAMESLPLAASQCDVVVASGSFHYASDPARVLAEAHRVLKPSGLLLVADSPTYRRSADGAAMVERRRIEHRRRYGIEGAAGGSSYLVLDPFVRLLAASGFAPTVRWPFPGLERWARARLAPWCGWAEPARFPVFVGAWRPRS